MSDMAKQAYEVDAMLPDPLPADPMPLAVAWCNEAVRLKKQPNPDAMAVATVDADGRPSLRIVLCRGWDTQAGVVTFFTNRTSRKGRALEAHAHAAADFFWDHLNRQMIVEGPVTHASDAESDAYFRRRPLISRIAAWASDQSKPIESRQAL
ncbi:MAG: pyridoxal 5'-phosphate synthase, partial [Phycisphaeraceae bacterium]